MFVCVRNSICGWKKNKKFLSQIFKITWKDFVSPSKKCQPYNFHIWELYDKHFFQKMKTSVFLPDCFIRIKQPQKQVYIFFNLFRNCMKIVWQAFFHTLVVWNCMISVFGVWRSTREIKLSWIFFIIRLFQWNHIVLMFSLNHKWLKDFLQLNLKNSNLCRPFFRSIKYIMSWNAKKKNCVNISSRSVFSKAIFPIKKRFCSF